MRLPLPRGEAVGASVGSERCPQHRRGYYLFTITVCFAGFLARELEICYAPLCYVSNYAEGVREREFRPGELFEGLADPQEREAMEAAVRLFPEIIAAIVPRLAEQSFACTCPSTMERYRRRGDLGPDWHTWFGHCS